MSFLTLEFLKVLNIDFPLILISLNVVEIAASLNDFSQIYPSELQLNKAYTSDT